MYKSKMVHKVGQILTDFDDFGVVEKPRISAFQRHQNHQKPGRIDPFHCTFLISSQVQIRNQIGLKSPALQFCVKSHTTFVFGLILITSHYPLDVFY